jgi:uncharacterized protein involved in exopolysaccharide biosynthesis
MATDFARDLEDQLVKTKAALQDQAEEMLSLLLQFEARLQERLDAAEARIAALRASYAQMSQDGDFAMARTTTEEPTRPPLGTDWTG